jgi:hypothetical protein
MKLMQSTTGSQELTRYFERGTPGWNQLPDWESNPIVIRFANDPAVWQSEACL